MKHQILHVIDHTCAGGAQVVVQYILSTLKDRFSFSVVVLGESGGFSRVYRELGVPVLELGSRGSRWNPSSLASLSRIVREANVDLIHTHLYKSNVLGVFATRCTGTRSILHDHAGIYPESLNYLFPGAVLRYIYLFAYRYALRQYDRILVLTQRDQEFYLRAYPCCRHKTVLLPNAVDLDEFSKTTHQAASKSLHRELGLPAETKLVMMVARLDPQKDWITFLQTASLVREQLEQCCSFLVVGSGPEELRLREYTSTHRIRDVHFLNHRRDIPSLLHQADVFLLTSRREPFGIVLLEAMAAGCPVVATRSGGPNSILTDGVDGLLADVGDAQGLSNHVLNLLRNDELSRRLAQNARETVANRYSVEAVSARISGIYKRVLES